MQVLRKHEPHWFTWAPKPIDGLDASVSSTADRLAMRQSQSMLTNCMGKWMSGSSTGWKSFTGRVFGEPLSIRVFCTISLVLLVQFRTHYKGDVQTITSDYDDNYLGKCSVSTTKLSLVCLPSEGKTLPQYTLVGNMYDSILGKSISFFTLYNLYTLILVAMTQMPCLYRFFCGYETFVNYWLLKKLPDVRPWRSRLKINQQQWKIKKFFFLWLFYLKRLVVFWWYLVN